MKSSENDHTYVYVTILVKMSQNFYSKITKRYQRNFKQTNLIRILQALTERREADDHEEFEIDFYLKNDLIYHFKDDKK